jgi:rhamnose utilization protein RhaD (predicted bifunctional aldolase and dehydrogenase)
MTQDGIGGGTGSDGVAAAPDAVTREMLARLHDLAHWLGDPARDCAILGEGNVSAAVGEDTQTFWLKTSGSSLGTMRPDQFVLMDTARTLAILEAGALTDDQIKAHLLDARADGARSGGMPSTEAALHAMCLTEGGARFVGHTHPTPWLSILCSGRAEEAIAGRMFPDEIVVCGPAPCFVPYVDPGPPLARACHAAVREYKQRWGVGPKVLLLRNHGLFALGQTDDEVKRITAMSTKVARALLGTWSLGGPRFLTEAQAERIYTRPDEHFRQAVLDGRTPNL